MSVIARTDYSFLPFFYITGLCVKSFPQTLPWLSSSWVCFFFLFMTGYLISSFFVRVLGHEFVHTVTESFITWRPYTKIIYTDWLKSRSEIQQGWYAAPRRKLPTYTSVFCCKTFKLNRDQLTAAFAMYLVFPKSTNIQESHFTGTAHFPIVQCIPNSCLILVGDESMLHLGRSQWFTEQDTEQDP